jgi:hypothetical protein
VRAIGRFFWASRWAQASLRPASGYPRFQCFAHFVALAPHGFAVRRYYPSRAPLRGASTANGSPKKSTEEKQKNKNLRKELAPLKNKLF